MRQTLTRITGKFVKRWKALAALTVVLAAVSALMVTAVSASRESVRHEGCADNLRQISLALSAYQSRRGSFPYAALPSDSLPPEKRLSWVIAVIPDMFCINCWGLVDFNEIDASKPWDVGAQNRLAVLPLEPMLCPSSPFRPAHGTHSSLHYVDRSQLSDPVPATYVGIAGLGSNAAFLPAGDRHAGVFGFGRVTRPQDISDGASTTIMVVETSDLRGVWVAGGEATVRGVDPAKRPYLGKGRPFGGNHPGKILALFADGSVRDIRDTMAPETFEAISTIAGGESLSPGWENKWVVGP